MTWAQPQASWLDRGARLHLHHGPIDLIIQSIGCDAAQSFEQAVARFQTILGELTTELVTLRRPTRGDTEWEGAVAQRMQNATDKFLPAFITPMAAVAGSVADELLAAMVEGCLLDKVVVNNGGDIAFHIAEGEIFSSEIAGEITGRLAVPSSSPVRGVATSGWRGRSFSLGIADGVTALAATAAAADAAATMVVNAVNLPGHPAITRTAASQLDPDSDLQDRLVTTGVDTLTKGEVDQAVAAGNRLANQLISAGQLEASLIWLNGASCAVGHDGLIET